MLTQDGCTIDRFVCVGKTDISRRGVPLTRVQFRRPDRRKVRYELARIAAGRFSVGQPYALVICPDDSPGGQDAPVVAIEEGSPVLHYSAWGKIRVHRPAVFLRRTGTASAVIRLLRHGPEITVALRNLAPASEPFPDPGDTSVILPGDNVLWSGRAARVAEFYGPDQAVICYHSGASDWLRPGILDKRKLVPLASLTPEG